MADANARTSRKSESTSAAKAARLRDRIAALKADLALLLQSQIPQKGHGALSGKRRSGRGRDAGGRQGRSRRPGRNGTGRDARLCEGLSPARRRHCRACRYGSGPSFRAALMAPLLRLATALAADRLGARVALALHRLALRLVAVLLALVGGGFLTAALYLALASRLGPITATLILGAGFLALAVVLTALAQGRPRAAPRAEAVRPPPSRPPPSHPLPAATGSPLLVLAAAFLGGLILALQRRR